MDSWKNEDNFFKKLKKIFLKKGIIYITLFMSFFTVSVMIFYVFLNFFVGH